MNKKRLLTVMGGSKYTWAVNLGALGVINGGSEASIDNLADNALTVEGWFRSNTSALQYLVSKSSNGSQGWVLYTVSGNSLRAQVSCATTTPIAASTLPSDNTFHHIAFTFDDAGDRKVRLFIDGILVGTSASAGSGAIVADAAEELKVRVIDNLSGWVRISNNVRYTTNFTVPSRSVYPDNDANTVRLYYVNEGTGTTIIDYSTNAQNAILVDGTWVKS